MRSAIRLLFLIAVITGFVSCKKKTEPNARQQQEETEIKEPLLINETLEQEGLRFKLDYVQANAQLTLNLFEGDRVKLIGVPLVEEQPYVNYEVKADKMKENSDFTLYVDFKNVTGSGTFNLSVIGFTDINNNKNFTVNGLPFTVSDNQTSKAVLKIHKGIRKFSFYKL